MFKLRVLLVVVALLLALVAVPVAAQDAVEITFMRFFGECADEFGETMPTCPRSLWRVRHHSNAGERL